MIDLPQKLHRWGFAPYLIRLALFASMTCLSPIATRGQDHGAPFDQPPVLGPRISDSFDSESRESYQISGGDAAVFWRQQAWHLRAESALSRTLESGPWIQTTWDIRSLGKTTDAVAFTIWFRHNDKKNGFLRAQQPPGGSATLSYWITDGDWTEEGDARRIREVKLAAPMTAGKWLIEIRFGACTVVDPKGERVFDASEDMFLGSDIQEIAIEVEAGEMVLDGLEFRSNDSQVPPADLDVDLDGNIALLEDSKRSLDQGDAKSALEAATASHQWLSQNLGRYHLFAMSAMFQLAECQAAQADREWSAETLLELQGLADEVYGPFHSFSIRMVHSVARNYFDAAEYQKAAEFFELSKDRTAVAFGENGKTFISRLAYVAWCYQMMGQPSKAIPYHVRALEIMESLGAESDPTYATLLSNASYCYHDMGELRKALDFVEKAKEVYETTGRQDDSGYATIIGNLAFQYEDLGRFEKAEQYHFQALALKENVFGKNDPNYGIAVSNISTYYYKLGNYREAERWARQGMDIMLAHYGPDHPEYAISLQQLAAVYHESGNYDLESPLLHQVERIFRSNYGEGHPRYARALNDLSIFYRSINDQRKAEEYAHRARDVVAKATSTTHPEYIRLTNALAEHYLSIGQHDRAEPYLREILAATDAAFGKQHPDYARGLNNLARIHAKRREWDEAVKLFEQASEILEATIGNQHPNYAGLLSNLADIYLQTRDLEKSQQLISAATEIIADAKGTQSPEYAEYRLKQAQHAFAGSKNDLAMELLLESAQLNQDHALRCSYIQSAQQQRYFARRQRQTIDWLLSIPRGAANQLDETAFQQVATFKGSTLIRQRSYRQLANSDSTAADFRDLRAIASELASHLQKPPTSPNWKRISDQLQRRREELEQSLAAASREFEVAASWVEPSHVTAALPDNCVMIDFFIYNHAELVAGEDVDQSFDNQQRLIAFVLTNQGANTTPAIERVDLGSMSSVESLIKQWLELATAGSSGIHAQTELRNVGVKLRDRIWNPLIDHVAGAQYVLISPDGAVGRLPLGALPGNQPNTYLIEQYPIAHVALPRWLPQIVKNSGQTGGRQRLLLVGGVDYDAEPGQSESVEDDLLVTNASLHRLRTGEGKYSFLNGTELETATIDSSIGTAVRSTRLTRAAATESAIIASIDDHNILHFATHGFFRLPKQIPLKQSGSELKLTDRQAALLENPDLLSGLVLAGANRSMGDIENRDDGILYSAEIATLPMNHVDLVVLSACDTAIGQNTGSSDGLVGIQRAFQVAGARSTIGSLWKVNDDATQRLMVRFYHNWIERGMSKLEALREAQLWMLRNPVAVDDITRGDPIDLPLATITEKVNTDVDEYRAHPRYWAAWVLSGDWR